MSGARDIRPNGDTAICMVIGCGRRALYRNASTASRVGYHGVTGTHGYCSAHRDRAISAASRRTADLYADHLVARGID